MGAKRSVKPVVRHGKTTHFFPNACSCAAGPAAPRDAFAPSLSQTVGYCTVTTESVCVSYNSTSVTRHSLSRIHPRTAIGSVCVSWVSSPLPNRNLIFTAFSSYYNPTSGPPTLRLHKTLRALRFVFSQSGHSPPTRSPKRRSKSGSRQLIKLVNGETGAGFPQPGG